MTTTARVPANKGKKLPPEVLTTDEAMSLLAACSSRAPTGVRNRALLTLLWRAGLRVGEALALQVKDLDAKRGSVSILHGKGNRSRVVGLDPEGFAVVQNWLDVRAKRVPGVKRSTPLLCNLTGGSLHGSYVRTLLRRLGRKAGIDKRCHGHGLRHTYAAELAASGTPTNVIQRALGHASLATTTVYLDHVHPEELLRVTRNRTWQEEPPAETDVLDGLSAGQLRQLIRDAASRARMA